MHTDNLTHFFLPNLYSLPRNLGCLYSGTAEFHKIIHYFRGTETRSTTYSDSQNLMHSNFEFRSWLYRTDLRLRSVFKIPVQPDLELSGT